MNILLIGSGGREHALAWKLAQSRVLGGGTLFVSPGNPGTAECGRNVPLDVKNHGKVAGFCAENDIGLVVIGPEAPLVDGLGDSLRASDIPVFGPDKAAAQLEGSKAFTKRLCDRAGIPTARYFEVATYDEGLTALEKLGEPPYVIKADGLAAGKGVVIAESPGEAHEALAEMFGGKFGDAGSQVVIEEFLTGEEASLFAITDGETVVPCGSAQDHKRVGDGDTGPNTGGMGAYSPAPVLTPELRERAMAEIIRPTVAAMKAEGTPYSGVLYAGLMLTADGPKLIEYNCRFGDPECQVLMTRLDSDLGELMLACAKGELAGIAAPQLSPDTAMTVVMAADGYPGTPARGGAIDLKDAEAGGAKVFHAGTRIEDGTLVAAGGRVLNVTASGPTVEAARDAAYAAVARIDFATGFYRSDIGHREIARERQRKSA
ncbi:phosphoribosylamine--glycine ligase [Alteriqipengyuania sp. WL0013]|uniref:phosphoribosylamine--glycine ligase n=1 Tax=Alteriqipengyuania sp. WL0013 TaxID=3110773 RepID=UPI002C0EA07A|nr:phosphoribosylamine--glycine ligase [Alteriqipengyuania sp. WL0013]MEB3416391.1 phosphoribosylamine--glycine ligase [Alteriqipengyuania sp. WL0013]